MDEPDEHALLDLLDRRGLDEVRADPPVLLGRVEHLVVDPAAVRGLQQRVVEEEAEAAAGASTRATSAIAASTSSMCSNTRQATTASNDASANGSRSAAGPGEARSPRPARRRRAIWFHVGSTPTTSSTPAQAGGEPGDLAVAAADVEDAPARPARRRPAAGSAPRTRGRRRR